LQPADVNTLATSKGGALTLAEEIELSQGSFVEAKITRSVWVQMTQLDKLTYHEIDANYITPIVAYLRFALGASVPLSGARLQLDDQWLDVVHSGMSLDEDENVAERDVFLPFQVAGLTVLSKFLDVYEQVGPAVAVTESALSNRRHATVDTLILELTTVAEGLHRTLFPEQERIPRADATRIRALIDGALRDETDPRYRQIVTGSAMRFLEEPNYKSRLHRLAEEVADAMPAVCGDRQKWVKKVDEARNSFAHRTGGFIPHDRVNETYILTKSLQWLLMGNVLLASGVPSETLRQRLDEYQPYQFFLRNARASASDVYDC